MKSSLSKVLKKITENSAELTVNNIVLIGGQARSGKSTIAKVIADKLSVEGFSSTTICLDHWIIDAKMRKPSFTVRERYDYTGILISIKKLLSEGHLFINHYEPKLKSHTKEKFQYNLSKRDILIIEGVPSLDINSLMKIATTSIFISISEKTRKQRFLEYYSKNGFTEKYSKDLYKKRYFDEIEIIEKTKQFADFVLNNNN